MIMNIHCNRSVVYQLDSRHVVFYKGCNEKPNLGCVTHTVLVQFYEQHYALHLYLIGTTRNIQVTLSISSISLYSSLKILQLCQ